MRFGNVHKSNWGILAAILDSFKTSFRLTGGMGASVQIPSWMYPRKLYKPNGTQERARRMRQIESGYLTAYNGLIDDGAIRGVIKLNSHGRIATTCKGWCQSADNDCNFPYCADVRPNGVSA
jgi:hypothetical protein